MIVVEQSRFDAALSLPLPYPPERIYDYKPSVRADVLDRAGWAYHYMKFLFPPDSDERALLSWLSETCHALMYPLDPSKPSAQ